MHKLKTGNYKLLVKSLAMISWADGNRVKSKSWEKLCNDGLVLYKDIPGIKMNILSSVSVLGRQW